MITITITRRDIAMLIFQDYGSENDREISTKMAIGLALLCPCLTKSELGRNHDLSLEIVQVQMFGRLAIGLAPLYSCIAKL